VSPTHRATLALRTEHAEVVCRALSPELTEKIPRTKIEVAAKDGEVVIGIEAEDLTALRAALNSYIRWGNVAEETAEEVGRI
jgi:tRNA threonylcarbamoyladenosine modification (KEOPS) complex  Pcc1 subunit